MDQKKAYEILADIVEGMAKRGEKVKLLPPEIHPDRTLDQLGVDLIAFSDVAEELSRRFEGKEFHLDGFMVPEEYYYLTLGRFLETVAKASKPTTRNPLVVYVDDEEENLFVFKRRLGKELNLKTFSDPTQALDFVRTNPDVALVITDEVMPGLSGNQLCDEVKKTQPNMKFILITGNPNGDEDLMYRSLRHSRFFEFLNKPLDFDRKGADYLKTIQALIA
jgi:CheY-like chemotaxis protein